MLLVRCEKSLLDVFTLYFVVIFDFFSLIPTLLDYQLFYFGIVHENISPCTSKNTLRLHKASMVFDS